MSLYKTTAYHGTLQENASEIINHGFEVRQVEGRMDDHWLGHGIYFFEKVDLASWWAKNKAKRFKERNKGSGFFSIIEVVLETEENFVLDLDKKEDAETFFGFCEGLDTDTIQIDFGKGLNKESKNFSEDLE
ncbi:MAG: hypothetical protein RR790_06865, partial [Eubacterium sp.]